MLDALLAAAAPTGPFVLLLLTIVLGGGAAWRTGQAVAESWGELWPVVAYSLPIAGAVRFLDYALFGGPLLSVESFAITFLILALIALDGAVSWRCARRLDRIGDPRALSAHERVAGLVRAATAPLHMSAVLVFGWLDLVRGVTGDLVAVDEILAALPPVLVLLASWAMTEKYRRPSASCAGPASSQAPPAGPRSV